MVGICPCYMCISRSGRFLLVANYVDGQVCMLPLSSTGRLEKVKTHASSTVVRVSPDRQ